MKTGTITLTLADEYATVALGEDIATALKPGDLVGLSGDLGSGKTTLARSIIRALSANREIEVPSPTYTLVQTYPSTPPVAHFDFYRLAAPQESHELGLEEALETGIALVEWPELGDLPPMTISISLEETAENGRVAKINAAPSASARLERSLQIRRFLDQSGYEGAHRAPRIGDASARAYETVDLDGHEPMLIMDAPEQPDGPPIRDGLPYSRIAHLSETVTPFVAIAHCLRQAGFAAPEVFAADLDSGILLLEHLGHDGMLDVERHPVTDRYETAAALLAKVHQRDWQAEIAAPFGAVHSVPLYDRDAMMIEVELLLDWYMPEMAGNQAEPSERTAFADAWTVTLDQLDDTEISLVMRDFHSPNLIWRSERQAFDKLGLIDFQDALIGPSAYDLASLAQDARATVPAALETHLVEYYCQQREAGGAFDRAAFEKAYAIMAVQRCSKILGIFVRLNRRDGKPIYLKHLPRMRDYLRRSIRHPALEPVADLYDRWNLLDEVEA